MLIKITCIGIGIIIGIITMLVAYVMYTEESDDVVSCKDCKWYNSKGYCEHWLRETDEDDFCSYQERRESGYEEEWQKWDADYSVRSNLEQFRVDEPHHSGEATEMVEPQIIACPIQEDYSALICETCKYYDAEVEAIACERCLDGRHSRYEPKDGLVKQADEMIKFDEEFLQMSEEQSERSSE